MKTLITLSILFVSSLTFTASAKASDTFEWMIQEDVPYFVFSVGALSLPLPSVAAEAAACTDLTESECERMSVSGNAYMPSMRFGYMDVDGAIMQQFSVELALTPEHHVFALSYVIAGWRGLGYFHAGVKFNLGYAHLLSPDKDKDYIHGLTVGIAPIVDFAIPWFLRTDYRFHIGGGFNWMLLSSGNYKRSRPFDGFSLFIGVSPNLN